jgi:outer membrane lipoprotein-sorting protein
MRKMLCLAAPWALALWSASALAQTPDDIIEKHLAALGGRTALAKLTSRTTSGVIALNTGGIELTGTVEGFYKAPNKSRILVKLDVSALGAGQVVNDQRFDGSTGYVIDTFNGNREITGGQLEALRNSAFPSPLLHYRESGATVVPTGREKVGSNDAHVIRLTPKTGPAVNLFIDTASFMLVRTVMTLNVPQLGGDIEQVIEFSDFRDVDGVKVPYITRSTNALQTVVATTKEVKHNTDIDDSSFSRPAGQ